MTYSNTHVATQFRMLVDSEASNHLVDNCLFPNVGREMLDFVKLYPSMWILRTHLLQGQEKGLFSHQLPASMALNSLFAHLLPFFQASKNIYFLLVKHWERVFLRSYKFAHGCRWLQNSAYDSRCWDITQYKLESSSSTEWLPLYNTNN